MSRQVFTVISILYALGIIIASIVFVSNSPYLLAIAAVLPEITLLFYLINVLVLFGRNKELIFLTAGMFFAVISTFFAALFSNDEMYSAATSISNVLRHLSYILSLGYVGNKQLSIKSLKNISIYLLIPFTLAVLLPALYLNGIDDGTHEWEIIAVFSISYIFVIQALRRRDFINRKSFTLIIACVLFFVIGDTLFGFDLYHNMPYVYEISNIFYFLAQYVLIYSVQAQYFEKPELKKYVDERKTNSKKEENMHLR